MMKIFLVVLMVVGVVGCQTTGVGEVRMATYTTVEWGSYYADGGIVKGDSEGDSSDSNYIVMRIVGLPSNRDFYPISTELTFNLTAVFGTVDVDVFAVVNAFQAIPAIGNQITTNPLWRFKDFPVLSFATGGGIGIPTTIVLDPEVLMPAWALPTYDNKKALTLIFYVHPKGGAIPRTITLGSSVSLTTVEVSGRTGLVGHQYIKDWNSRTGTGGLVCPKTGQWIARNEAVRDGYLGVLVAPESYDPPEPKQLPQTWRSENRGDIRDDRDDL